MPNVTRTLAVTTETVCVWRDGSVMVRHVRLKMEEDVSSCPFLILLYFPYVALTREAVC